MNRTALLVVPLILAGCFGGSKSEKVIPWIADRPNLTRIASRPLARACRSSDLHASLFLQGATGSLVGGVTLRQIGRTPCALVGQPSVRFAGKAARRTRWRIHTMHVLGGVDPSAIVLPRSSLRSMRPDEEAFVQMVWSNWCGPDSQPASGPGPAPRAIVLSLPRGGGEFRLRTQDRPIAPRCDVPGWPSNLGVTVFLPAEHYPPDSTHLPLLATIVGVERRQRKEVRFRVKAGRLFHYRVALKNVSRQPFQFKSCPVYVEGLAANTREERHVLNCRPVDHSMRVRGSSSKWFCRCRRTRRSATTG